MEEKRVNIVHYIIVFCLCFLFRFLPPIGDITPYGMGILGTFIGAIYGWSVIGMAWTTLMCLVGIGLTIGANQMIAACFNMTIVGMMFIMFITHKLNSTGATTWLVNTILSSKISKGRPWLVIAVLFVAAYIGGLLNSAVMAIIFISICTYMFKSLGVPAYDKLITCTMLGMALAIILGQIGVPVMGSGLMVIAIYNAMAASPMNFVSYFLFMLPMDAAIMAFYMLLMKFVFRVNVTPLKEFDPEIVGGRKPATRDQKLAIFFLAFFMVLVFASSIVFFGPVFQFLQKFGLFGMAAVCICLMMLLKDEEGKPFLNFREAGTSVSWEITLMVGYIMVISSYMNTPETGITPTLMSILTPFTSMHPLVFIVIALFIAMFLTNIAANLIIVAMILPLMLNFAGMVGMNPLMLGLLVFLITHVAIATPAACPSTGIIYSATDLVKSADMTKTALIALPLIFIFTLIVGIPYANLIL